MSTSRQLTAELHPSLAVAVAFALAPLARFALAPRGGVNVAAALDHLRAMRRAVMRAQAIDPGYRAQLVEHLTLVRDHGCAAAALLRRQARGSHGAPDDIARSNAYERLGTAAGDTVLALQALASL